MYVAHAAMCLVDGSIIVPDNVASLRFAITDYSSLVGTRISPSKKLQLFYQNSFKNMDFFYVFLPFDGKLKFKTQKN